MRLQPKSFIRKIRHKNLLPRPKEIGFVAQDVQKVIPEAVVMLESDGEPTLALYSEMITAALVNAFKEMNARVTALEGRTA
jgi:hypothetical protein